MGVATLVATLLIIGYLIVGEWWLLPITVLAIVTGTGLVLAAFMQTLGAGRDPRGT